MQPGKCPAGHSLPREGCTPFYCLEQRGGKAKEARKRPKERSLGQPRDMEKVNRRDTATTRARKETLQAAMVPLGEAPAGADEADGQAKEASRLSVMAGKYAARLGVSKTPQELKGGDAEEYAAKKLVEMLPMAVHEVEHQLKFGDDKQRMDAARDVLDANGMRRREQVGNMVPPIVLNFTGVLPWMQVPGVAAETARKVKANAEVVDGEATRSEGGQGGPNRDGP